MIRDIAMSLYLKVSGRRLRSSHPRTPDLLEDLDRPLRPAEGVIEVARVGFTEGRTAEEPAYELSCSAGPSAPTV